MNNVFNKKLYITDKIGKTSSKRIDQIIQFFGKKN
jgi:hypothetical protein